MQKHLCWLFIGLVLVSAQAETLLFFDQWVTNAAKSHPRITALEAEIEAARAGTQQARIRPVPEFSLEAGYKDSDADNGYVAGAGLMFPIERSGKRNARISLAEHEITRVELELAQFKRKLEFQIKTLGYEYVMASADTAVAREIAERCHSLIDQLKQRPAAGPSAFLELTIMETGLLEFQQSVRENAIRRDSAQIKLNTLLGRESAAELNFSLNRDIPIVGKNRDALFQSLENNPSVQARRIALTQRELEVVATSLQSRPDYEIGPFVEREDAGESETVFGVAVSIPLSSRSRNQGAMAAARALQEHAAADLNIERRTETGELTRLIRSYELDMEQLESIPPTSIAHLKDAAALADREYRLGAVPIQLFLDMQREYLAVQQRRNAALLSAWRHALEIQQMTGIAPEESP